jgi:hypothetical protein
MYGGRARPPYSSRRPFLKGQQLGIRSMNRLLLQLAIIATASSPLFSNPILAQILPPAKKAEHVEITKGPELESAVYYMAIVRWTTTNPRGDDEHYGVVHYGTAPEDLSQTAKGHIRLNRAHPETIFRVRLVDLRPQCPNLNRIGCHGHARRLTRSCAEAM